MCAGRLRPLPLPMPYLIAPRRRITLNFQATDYDALAADAARAGHAAPSAYALPWSKRAARRRALERALATRPTQADYQQQLAEAVDKAVTALITKTEAAPSSTEAPPPLTPEQETRAEASPSPAPTRRGPRSQVAVAKVNLRRA
ncbi:hypothetical protein [Hymenobacter bucti]|uniref:Uncharacterized protein n=1 Tax=Hymenobacter bucti TaxID=1844114 RepID=A0ABW4QYY6_9BACT